MLLAMFQSLAVISFLLAAAAFFIERKGARLVMQGLAFILFAALAIAASNIEQQFCFGGFTQNLATTSSFCTLQAVFDSGLMWLFASLASLQIVLIFVTVFQHMERDDTGSEAY